MTMRPAAFLLCLLCPLLGGAPLTAGAWAEALPQVTATPVPLDPADPELSGIGKLTFLGGLELASDDPRFGGWSDLVLSPDGGQLTAIGDQGAWMTGRLHWDAKGHLAGFQLSGLGQLKDLAGQALDGKEMTDAEGLTTAAEGGFLVAFERQHRIWRYGPDLSATPLEARTPTAVQGLEATEANHGMEALARLADGTLVILLEGAEGGTSTLMFRLKGATWSTTPYLRQDAFQITGAAGLASGGLLVLERFYTPETGPKMRLRYFTEAELQQPQLQGGHLVGELGLPLTVDNFEGLAVVQAGGALRLLIMSDDNFNHPEQRTLLLAFELTFD